MALNFNEQVAQLLAYQPATLEQNNQHAQLHQFEGGWCYQIHVNPTFETIQYVQHTFKSAIKNKNLSRITLQIGFIPAYIFNQIFQPTTTLPFGWKRHSTPKGTEVITIRHNFDNLNFLLGETWTTFVFGDFRFELDKKFGFKIRRSLFGSVSMKCGFIRYVAQSNILY